MNPKNIYPIKDFKNTVFLKPLIEQSDVENVIAGEYSYYSDFKDPKLFLENNVLYNYGISGTSLKIGKFCAIAHGTKFIMADANHATKGITTFPFAVFGDKWSEAMPLSEYPFKKYGDIVIGNDVWLGHGVTIMPGIKIGDGAIVGGKAVVTSNIPPYSIAVGNPAKVIRVRFSDADQNILKDLEWWNWPINSIESAIPVLVKGNILELQQYAIDNKLKR